MNHHHSHSHLHAQKPASTKPEELNRYKSTKRITLIGALVNILLSIFKIIAGYFGQSQALIADGIHSLSDLLSDGLVLIAAKHTSRGADAEHPYGHGRIETLITVAMGIFLMVIACGIIIDAARRIIEPSLLLHPGFLALLVAVLSVISKEILYKATIRVALKFQSNLLKANAWHHRSDAISSIPVVVGIAGSMMGIEYLDAIAAIGMAMFIIKIGWELSLQSIRELVDTSLEPDRVKAIRDSIMNVAGVRELHSLRTRRMGSDALVDVHIIVDPKLSVSEGHYISEKVRQSLIEHIDEVADVMVHIDPEDDEISMPSDDLPGRRTVLHSLHQQWENIEEAALIDNVTLHYLDGKIHVELSLPLHKMDDTKHARDLAKKLITATREDKNIAETKVLFY